MGYELIVYDDEALSGYSFGNDHPFGPKRYQSFNQEYIKQGLDKVTAHGKSHIATPQQITLFHTHEYLAQVIEKSINGKGYLDYGDTPAFAGIYEAASRVVGTVLNGVDKVMLGEYQRAFIPVAGLHHARRDRAAGFCAFNDCGIAIEYLRQEYNINNIAYIDIDAHHGDGVFYGFESDPHLFFADIHEDGRFLYPGTGFLDETGKAKAKGTKLNLPVPAHSDDKRFNKEWEKVENYLHQIKPEFILFQCGADSLANDPITDLDFTAHSHGYAALRLRKIADQYANGRIVAMGGGGYNLVNIAVAWCAVISSLS